MVVKITPFRERLRHKRRIVLFICTGNTCRSPMAATYFRKLLDDRGIRDVDVRSAGVMTITGLLASAEAIQVMDAEGVELRRHRSTQLTPELIRKADLILAMSPFHRQTALRMCEDAKNKTFLFKEFCRSDLKNVQIADPMGCTLEVFKKCFKEVKAACDRLIDHEFVSGKPIAPKIVVKKPVAKPGKKGAAPKKAVAGAKKSAVKAKAEEGEAGSRRSSSRSGSAKPALSAKSKSSEK